jgi:Glycosyl hydrolase family 26
MTKTGCAGLQVPIGVYRGDTPDLDPITAYEGFLGGTVDYVLVFMADSPTWAQFEAANLQATTNGPAGTMTAGDWAPLLGTRTLMLAVPACCGGTSWADEAAGANDAHWAALARNLASAGLGTCALRIGRELNGSWYRWQVNPGNAADYRAGYTRIVSVMRGAGFTGMFVWNPYLGQGTMGPSHGVESAYPGDAVVDVIGLDIYDGNWSGVYPGQWDLVTTAQQRTVWDGMLTEWDSLRGWWNLALSHGKKLCFPEWGLRLWKDSGVYHGGGDNALLVREMGEFISGCAAWMHALWEDVGMGVSDPDDSPQRLVPVPQARAAFLRSFGR